MNEFGESGAGARASDILLEPASGWQPVDWRELVRYRDLFRFLVLRSVKTRYVQSVLGVGWAVIQPLFSMVVFAVVFGKLAQISSDGAPYALFSFTALVPWTFFSSALTESTNSLTSNGGMLSKVYFPRLILPLAAAAARLVDFGIAFVLLLAVLLFAGRIPTAGIAAIPLLVAIMGATAAGCGMWLTALAIQYRDINYAAGFIVQLAMYASPVVYPTTLVPERYLPLYALNPMVGVIEGFRSSLLATRPMPWGLIAEGTVVAAALTISGAFYFRRQEHLFADVA